MEHPDYFGRSKSYGPGMMMHNHNHNHNHMEITSYHHHPHPPAYDLRCYSVSYAQSQMTTTTNFDNGTGNYQVNDFKLKKAKSTSASKAWSTIADPEFQRKKRVAGYKMYSVEGKVKGSFRKSFRWLKDRYTRMIYGC